MIGFGRPGAVAEGWPTLGAGPTERLRVLAVGDRYVPAALLGARLAAHQPHGLAFDLHEVDLPYPTAATIPLPDDRRQVEIRAFWEEIDAIAARLHADEADPGLREYTGPVDRLVPLIGDAEVLLVHAAPVSRAAVRAAGALRWSARSAAARSTSTSTRSASAGSPSSTPRAATRRRSRSSSPAR